MRPIGGYPELEGCGNEFPHADGVLLNSGSYALQCIIDRLGIRRLWIPSFTCSIVPQRVREAGREVLTYSIDRDFCPTEEFGADDFAVYNNWFGCMGLKVDEMLRHHPNLIVDNAQAFYSEKMGRASLYSPRKFFGLSDGGIACFSDRQLNCPASDLPVDVSYDRMLHILKRVDCGATAAYADFHVNSKKLAEAPMARMSLLTRRMLGNIDYGAAAFARKGNFDYLHAHLCSQFPFALADDDVPLVYPYVTEDRMLRKRLIEQQIFVATYWPGLGDCDWHVNNILPLPIDQRYGEEDMARIVDAIKKYERA